MIDPRKTIQFFRWVSCAVVLCLSLTLAQPSFSQENQDDAARQPMEMSSVSNAALENPLSPLPMSSPRQTLSSFLFLARDAQNAMLQAIDIAANNNDLFDTQEIKTLKRQAIQQMVKASSTLDLSAVAPENRKTLGINSVLLLKEILERISVPPLDQVPDIQNVNDGGKAAEWILPGTEISIINKPTENGRAHFVFSQETVERLPEFYELVKALPQQTGGSVDFYKSFVLGPGLLLPVELNRHVMNLPNWALAEFSGQAVWQWLAFALLSVILTGLIWTMLRKTNWRSSNAIALGRIVVPFAIACIFWAYGVICDDLINLTGSVEATLELVIICLQAVALALGVVMTSNAIAHVAASLPKIKVQALDASLIRLGIRVVGILFASYILALAAARIGMPLYGIIASLGVGGLALALAVRPTLENFIGGIILYADKPVKVGDVCKFGNIKGTVETIGLRSTRIRADDRTLITVQNSDFVEMSIINFSRRHSELFSADFTLAANVEQSKISQAINDIADYLKTADAVMGPSVQVYLNSAENNALKLESRAYVSKNTEREFSKIREDLLLGIVDILRNKEVATV